MEWSRIADGMLDDDGSTNMTVKSLLIQTKYTVAVLVMGRARWRQPSVNYATGLGKLMGMGKIRSAVDSIPLNLSSEIFHRRPDLVQIRSLGWLHKWAKVMTRSSAIVADRATVSQNVVNCCTTVETSYTMNPQ